MKVCWGRHGGPDNQDPKHLPVWSKWDLSISNIKGAKGQGPALRPVPARRRSNHCTPDLGPAVGLPPQASLCSRAGPGAAFRREQALEQSKGFSFWRELPPLRSCRAAWRDVWGRQRPPVRGPGPGPRPAPGSHPLPLPLAVPAVAHVPPWRRARAQGGPGAPELGGHGAVGFRGRDDGPGELGGGDRPWPVPPDSPSVPGAHQLGPT